MKGVFRMKGSNFSSSRLKARVTLTLSRFRTLPTESICCKQLWMAIRDEAER